MNLCIGRNNLEIPSKDSSANTQARRPSLGRRQTMPAVVGGCATGSSKENRGLVMRRLIALVATFAIISSNAWAFDPSPEVVGQIYFSIPFGAATKQEGTPRLGFRVGYGEELTFADHQARAQYGVLDWQANLNGQATLLINGVDTAQLSRVLYAAEDEGQTDGVSAAGAMIFIGLGVLVGGVAYYCINGALENLQDPPCE